MKHRFGEMRALKWNLGTKAKNDSKDSALRRGRSNVLLIETSTGRELALLESPEPHDIFHLCFTADDTKLVVALGNHPLRVWDLRRIRQQLAGMGLDWEAPPLPAQSSKPVVTSMKVITDPPPASAGQPSVP